MEPMVSVIVPIYNSEKTLRKCINSILEQSFCGIFEVILVNDGSKDGSGVICKEYERKNDGIIYLEQDNKGASCARNAGIEKASGKYVTFVDSDDCIKKDFLKIMVEYAEKSNAQLVACEFTNHDPDTGLKDRMCSYDRNVVRSGKGMREELTFKAFDNKAKQNMTNSVCKLFLRSILVDNDIRFKPYVKLFEDTLFMTEYYWHINKFVYIHKSLYKRLLHEGSEIKSFKPDVYSDVSSTLREYYAIKNKYGFSGGFESRFAWDICKLIINLNLLRKENDESISDKNKGFYRFVSESIFFDLYTRMDVNKITGKRNRIKCFLVKNNLLVLILMYKKYTK